MQAEKEQLMKCNGCVGIAHFWKKTKQNKTKQNKTKQNKNKTKQKNK